MSERPAIETLKDTKDGHDRLETFLWDIYELLTTLAQTISLHTPEVKRWADFLDGVQSDFATDVREELLADAQSRIEEAQASLADFRFLINGLRYTEDELSTTDFDAAVDAMRHLRLEDLDALLTETGRRVRELQDIDDDRYVYGNDGLADALGMDLTKVRVQRILGKHPLICGKAQFAGNGEIWPNFFSSPFRWLKSDIEAFRAGEL